MSKNLTVWMLDPAAFTLFYERPLLEGLAKIGIEPHLFTTKSIYNLPAAPHPSLETNFYFKMLEKVPVLNKFSPIRRITRGFHYPVDQSRLTRLIHSKKPEVVHVQWALIPLVDRRTWQEWHKLGCKIVFTGHDLVPNHLPAKAAKPFFELYHQADAIILHSEHNRDSLLKWVKHVFPNNDGSLAQKIHVIPMGIPDNHQDIVREEAREALQIGQNVPVLLFLGNLRNYKGVPILIEAFRKVIEKIPRAELIIAGLVMNDFEGRAEHLRDMTRNIPNVRLNLEFIPYEKASTYYAAADITVLPYLYITQSAVALAALAQGCPMVASDVGGLSDIVIHGETGLLVPPNDSDKLADALIDLLKNPDLRQKMSQNARALAQQKYSWDAIAVQTKAVYEEILK